MKIALITGHVIMPPEHRERMIALGADPGSGPGARSRGEAGCLAHHCHVDVEDALRLTFVEEWESIDAVRAHVIPDPDPGSRCPRRAPSSPTPDQVRGDLRRFSLAPPVIRIWSAEDVTATLTG